MGDKLEESLENLKGLKKNLGETDGADLAAKAEKATNVIYGLRNAGKAFISAANGYESITGRGKGTLEKGKKAILDTLKKGLVSFGVALENLDINAGALTKLKIK